MLEVRRHFQARGTHPESQEAPGAVRVYLYSHRDIARDHFLQPRRRSKCRAGDISDRHDNYQLYLRVRWLRGEQNLSAHEGERWEMTSANFCSSQGADSALFAYEHSRRRVAGMSNNITGANAGGLRQSPIRTRWAARIAQFRRSATVHK